MRPLLVLCPWVLVAALIPAFALPGLSAAADLALAPALSQDEAASLAQTLGDAQRQGLASPAAGLASRFADTPDPILREAAVQLMVRDAIAFARSQRGNLPDPTAIDRGLALKVPYDAEADFESARQAGRVADWAAGQLRTDAAFLGLVAARDHYAQIVAAGGWDAVEAGPAPEPDAMDARLPALRQRLALEGYATAVAADETVFDASLAAALSAFQAHHGLPADGRLTEATIAALNVPAETRLATLDANLERARWLPIRLPATRIEVDIADPTAVLFQGDAPTLSMHAIVGDLKHHTPTFASEVQAVVVNPPWVVPTEIAARELYPHERRSPGYLARSGFRVVGGQLVQTPGPKAALGYLKFDMPDPFQVYLHDTPARTLFAQQRRWLSHGCVRLEAPRDLAAALLSAQGWDRAQVDAAIAGGRTFRVGLAAPIAVFVVYRTAVADAAGQVTFRPDIYGWDAKITAALRRLQPTDLDQGG